VTAGPPGANGPLSPPPRVVGAPAVSFPRPRRFPDG